MKEYCYRTLAKYRNRPHYILFVVFAVFMFAASGMYAPCVFFVSAPIMSIFRIKSQVEYIVPRTDEEIKKESYGAVAMALLYEVFAILISQPVIFTFYDGTKERFMAHPIMLIFYYVAMICLLFNITVSSEVKENTIEVDEKSKIIKKIFEQFQIVVVMLIVCSYFIVWGIEDVFAVAGKFSNIICIVLAFLSLELIVTGFFALKNWKIGDYRE